MERESFDDLDAALAALEAQATELRSERLPSVSMVREFASGDRVAARLEVSIGGWLRGRAAGVDVMGDGSVVPYSGGVRRHPLEADDRGSPFDAVRRELS